MTKVICPWTDCKHNTVVRLDGGARRKNCCTLDELVLTTEEYTPNLYCEAFDHEE